MVARKSLSPASRELSRRESLGKPPPLGEVAAKPTERALRDPVAFHVEHTVTRPVAFHVEHITRLAVFHVEQIAFNASRYLENDRPSHPLPFLPMFHVKHAFAW